MAKRRQIYKCDACGNIVEVLEGGDGALVCCGEDMKLFEESSTDEGKEKHVPVIENAGDGVKVKVGSNPHPMEEKHYIEWIQLITDNGFYRKFLKPGDKPQAFFKINENPVGAREYCNIHGLWKS